MKKLSVISVIVTISSLTANISSLKTFNGFYLGAGMGYVGSTTTVDVNETFEAWTKHDGLPLNKSKKSNNLFFSVYAGYGKNLNNFYLGVETSITKDFTKRNVDLVNAPDPNLPHVSFLCNTKYERDLSIGFSPRFGYVFSNNLIYIKPGIEISRDKVTSSYKHVNSLTGITMQKSDSTTKTSVVFTPAFGYEQAYGHIILRGEYTYNPGRKISINSKATEIAGYDNARYSNHRIMIGVSYNF